MEPVKATTAHLRAQTGEQSLSATEPGLGDGTEHAEESFEATILRMDGAALEQLFRLAGL